MVHDVSDDVINSVIDPLDHTRENKARFDHILIRIDADYEMSRAAVLFSLLLDRVESAQSGIACGSEDHIGAFADLRERQLFTFTWVVPRTVSHTDVVFDHTNVWVY